MPQAAREPSAASDDGALLIATGALTVCWAWRPASSHSQGSRWYHLSVDAQDRVEAPEVRATALEAKLGE